MTRGSLFNGNYRFSNIIVSGSAQERYPVPYTEMSFYSNCFAFEQPHMYCTDEDCLAQGYYLQSEYGWYYLEKSEGEWLTLSDMESPYDNFFTHSSLPMLSQKDVLYYPETGTIRISDAYLKHLIFTWCYCGMTVSIQLAENLSINLYDMLPYVSDGTLEAVFSLSENGSLRGLRVELNCTSGQSLYALGYEKQSDGLLAFADWGEMQMRVQLTPGDGCNSVDFTLADRATGDELLTIGAQIYEDIGDFAPSAEMQQYIDMLDRELLIRKTIAERYTGKYKRTSGTCSEIAVYDEEFGYYIYFYEKSGVFQYRGYSPTLTDCCVAEINFMKRTLTPTKHATKEAMDIAMTARYALIVVKPDQPCEAIAVYDEEFDTYALFLLTIEGPYLYAGHTDLPSVLIYFCKGTLNMSNGQLTTQTHIHYFEQEDAE
jgi:hypothetical protein